MAFKKEVPSQKAKQLGPVAFLHMRRTQAACSFNEVATDEVELAYRPRCIFLSYVA